MPDLFMLCKCAAVRECPNIVNTFIAMASKAHNTQEETAICFSQAPIDSIFSFFCITIEALNIQACFVISSCTKYTSFLRGGLDSFGQRLISLIVKAKRMDFFPQFFLLLKILGQKKLIFSDFREFFSFSDFRIFFYIF